MQKCLWYAYDINYFGNRRISLWHLFFEIDPDILWLKFI